MFMKPQSHNDDKISAKQKLPKPATQNPNICAPQQTHLDAIIQRVKLDPHSLSSYQAQQLQQTVGNQALGEFLTLASKYSPIQKKDKKTSLPNHLKIYFKNNAEVSGVVQRSGHKCKCGRSFGTERGLKQHFRLQGNPLVHGGESDEKLMESGDSLGGESDEKLIDWDGSLSEEREKEFTDWKNEFMDSGDGLYIELKEVASEEQEEQLPEMNNWREDKSQGFGFQYGKDRSEHGTLQGTGNQFKGGSTYHDELHDLKEELKDDMDVDSDEVNNAMWEELRKGVDQESDYLSANRTSAIVTMSEASRAAFNPTSYEAMLENSENEDKDVAETFRNQVVFGKARKKSAASRKKKIDKKLDKLKKKKKKSGMNEKEYKAEVQKINDSEKRSLLWESKTKGNMGGSLQSQYGRPRMKEKKFKRQGSFEERINSEKRNFVKSVKKRFRQKKSEGKTPNEVAEKFVRDSVKKRAKKNKGFMELDEKSSE